MYFWAAPLELVCVPFGYAGSGPDRLGHFKIWTAERALEGPVGRDCQYSFLEKMCLAQPSAQEKLIFPVARRFLRDYDLRAEPSLRRLGGFLRTSLPVFSALSVALDACRCRGWACRGPPGKYQRRFEGCRLGSPRLRLRPGVSRCVLFCRRNHGALQLCISKV